MTSARAGFTLAEIAIAVGLAAFCLIAVLGLLPAAINANRMSLETTRAAALAEAVEADLRALPAVSTRPLYTPRFRLEVPAPAALQTIFLGEDGAVTNAAAARYRVTLCGPKPRAGSGHALWAAAILVTWPAAADASPTAWPTNASGRFESLVLLPPP